MSENAAIIAGIIEHNTGGQNLPTIDRNHIDVIASHHSRFDGDLDDAIAEALAEGYELAEILDIHKSAVSRLHHRAESRTITEFVAETTA